MTTPEAALAAAFRALNPEDWPAYGMDKSAAATVAALHDAGYALTPLAPEVPPRWTPKAGTAVQTSSGSRLTTLAATRTPEPPDSGLEDAHAALASALLWLDGKYAETPREEFNRGAWSATARSGLAALHLAIDARRPAALRRRLSGAWEPRLRDCAPGVEPPDSGDGAALRDLEARIRGLFINDNNFGGPSAETVKAHNIAIEQALAQFIPLIDVMQPRSGSPAPEGGE